MVKIKKQLINSTSRAYGTNNRKTYITIHETGNTDRGTGAQTHANLQSNGFSSTWHWQVDDKEAIQSFDHKWQLWHAGDGRGNGNLNSIGIEICVNSDGNFKKAVENAAELTKKIIKDEGISINNVVQHNNWSGKNCPMNLRNGSKGVNWNGFINMVKGASGKTSNTSSSSNSSSSSSSSSSNKIEWVGTNDKGKRIEAIVPSVNFYDTQRWTNPTGQFKKGEGWIVDNLYRVNGSLQYRVQNSKGDLYYITARKDLVRIVDNTSSARSSGNSSSSKRYPLPSGVYYRSKDGHRSLNAVKQIQRALNAAYFKVGKIDGYYGAKTEDAVRRFQSVYLPYEIDGVYGANTRRELDKKVN